MAHQVGINLIAAQLVVAAFAGRLRIMHTNPCVSHYQIGSSYGFDRVAFDRDRHAFGAGLIQKNGFGVKRLRPRERKVKAKLSAPAGK